MGDDRRRAEDAALVHLLDRPATVLAQALLDLPDRLGRVGVDAGAELLGQLGRGPEHLGRAVEEVLEPDPAAHPTVRRGEVALEQAAVGLDRLEVVVAIGAVRGQRGADAHLGGRLGRALHESPHVEHRGRAAPQRLGVGHVRRGAGDLGRERPMGRVDVVLQPLPQRHRLRRAAEQPGVQVAVVEPGDHGVHRRVDRRHRRPRPDAWPPRSGGPTAAITPSTTSTEPGS